MTLSLEQTPTDPLPIEQVLDDLVMQLSQHSQAILVAEPGAGKTTRVPLRLIQETPAQGRWLLLEPRRVATRLAATYMAQHLGESVGQTVGYRVRGESRVSPKTRLEVITQGILTRWLQDDPMLEGVAGIIFDEFHERSLEADLGLALSLDIKHGLREDLQLLVMSATLDVAALLAVMGESTPVIACAGRTFPIDTHYRPPTRRQAPVDHQLSVIQEALAQTRGDILVFLPGQAEINRLGQALTAQLPPHIEWHALHGQLPLKTQQAVLHTSDQRRIILATDIAESSLTVPGVRVVIDAGKVRSPRFSARTGLTQLDTFSINRASADQRRGRAGRVAPGVAYRLWSAEEPLPAHGEPAIQQDDLTTLAFELARWGIADPSHLSWVTPPPPAALAQGRQLLQKLELLAKDNTLTPSGRQASRWPTHPRLAHLIEQAQKHHAQSLACWLVAALEGQFHRTSDLETLLAQRPGSQTQGALRHWYQQARLWAKRLNVSLEPVDMTPLPRLLAAAFPDRIAQYQGEAGRFKLVNGMQSRLPEHHPLAQSPWLVVVDADGRADQSRIYQAVAIDLDTLETDCLETQHWHTHLYWSTTAERLIGEQVRSLGPLIIQQKPLTEWPEEAARQALLKALQQKGTLPWSDHDQQLLGRLSLLHEQLGAPWPDVSPEALMTSLDDWLGPHLIGITRFSELARLPLGQYLLESLPWSQQRELDTLAPTHITVPSGDRIRLDYQSTPPVLAVKLQAVFGLSDTPKVVQGRIAVMMHLLSPAQRPVQVTQDLANFWRQGYFDVKKDLKGRYPKHPWPDDPLIAIPTLKTQKAAKGR